MLKKEAKLNENVFSADVEMLPIRDGYGKGLVVAGEMDQSVVVLSADLTESTRSQEFSEKFPERFFELGVAEQNMAAVASGLGISGKIPFISSYATFSPGRNWEQIRTTISYNNSNVKIAGSHAGISVGPDGATHQALEDIAITRVLPNMTVVVPCDAIETKKATLAAIGIVGPYYSRFAREKTPVITKEDTAFVLGKALPIIAGDDVTIIANGQMVYRAIMAAKELEGKVSVRVLNMHTVKPIDAGAVIDAAKDTGAIVTAEEHQIIGGFGSAVAEVVTAHHPVPVERVGVLDTFGESGRPEELMEHYRLGVSDIVHAVERVIRRKNAS